ncbi:hypothetical protein ACIA8C_37715 [Nocardia sp. NPDC051321]|uniref:hypothetical protein n=1 Tax=Nocardia sp. NPDC051321 TaxID=3364323 RepID=UPI003789638A
MVIASALTAARGIERTEPAGWVFQALDGVAQIGGASGAAQSVATACTGAAQKKRAQTAAARVGMKYRIVDSVLSYPRLKLKAGRANSANH